MPSQGRQNHRHRHDHDSRRPLIRRGDGRAVIGGSRHRCGRAKLAWGLRATRLVAITFGPNMWDSRDLGAKCLGPNRAESATGFGNLSQLHFWCQRLRRDLRRFPYTETSRTSSSSHVILRKQLRTNTREPICRENIAFFLSFDYHQLSENGGNYRPTRGWGKVSSRQCRDRQSPVFRSVNKRLQSAERAVSVVHGRCCPRSWHVREMRFEPTGALNSR
jgi:hypothetical protein